MIDLYTALKLCSNNTYIRIDGDEYKVEQIVNKFDLRKVKVKKIYFNLWYEAMCFETE